MTKCETCGSSRVRRIGDAIGGSTPVWWCACCGSAFDRHGPFISMLAAQVGVLLSDDASEATP